MQRKRHKSRFIAAILPRVESQRSHARPRRVSRLLLAAARKAMSSSAATLCQHFISAPRRRTLEDDGNLAEMVGGLGLPLLTGSRVRRGIKAGPERERMAGY